VRTLVIDTSGIALSIALFNGGEMLASRHEIIGRGHAEAIVPWIADLPDGGRASTIIVGCGPGSFTGIRAGVAAAHGLGLGWQATTYGLNSLALIAASVPDPDAQEVLVAIDGGHGELFLQAFTLHPVRRIGEAVSATVNDAAMRFPQHLVIGNAASKLVAARGHGSACEGEANAQHWQALDREETSLAVTPLYVRAPDAKPMAPRQ
jgi:tRNA threonylcarbamoyladenosine biosynthesis protein TsaB